MATLYVSEFSALGRGSNNIAPIAALPALASQTVAIGGASTASAAFNGGTSYIRVHTDVVCSIAAGSAAGVLSTGDGPAMDANSWGIASGFDAAGRSIVRNSAALVSDALATSSRADCYLGRDGSNTAYGDGHYDFLAISPYRLSDARLTALAVPA